MLWHCLACTTEYAQSLPACPHCRSGERRPAHEVEEEAVAKISRWGREPEAVPDEAVPEAAADAPVEPEAAAESEAAGPEPAEKPAPPKAKDG